ncbi:hypothetical protein BCR44DRAFT_400940, partial [Catenaria anguillulae PL171]
MNLDGVTEYKDRYPTHPVVFNGQRKPPAHSAVSNAPCSSVTESRQQFTPKSIPPKFKPPKREYQPTGAPLESKTGYMADFQKWNCPPRESAKKPEVYKPGGPLEGVTTNKADYQSWEIPERYRHPKQKYNPNPAKLESNSSYKADFAPFAVQRPTPRPPEVYHAVTEDRSFGTTTKDSYVGFTGTRPQRRIQVYHPPGTTFEGDSTSHTDYAPPNSSGRRESCKPPHSLPPSIPFTGQTEYHNVFVGKPVGPRYKRPPQQYVPNPAHLDGMSTMKTDFTQYTGVHKREDYSPKLAYNPDRDDRSWVTETRDQHGKKDVATCQAVKYKNQIGGVTRREKDGHVYLVPVTGSNGNLTASGAQKAKVAA